MLFATQCFCNGKARILLRRAPEMVIATVQQTTDKVVHIWQHGDTKDNNDVKHGLDNTTVETESLIKPINKHLWYHLLAGTQHPIHC